MCGKRRRKEEGKIESVSRTPPTTTVRDMDELGGGGFDEDGNAFFDEKCNAK